MHFTGVLGTSAWPGVYVTQVCFYTNVHICDTLAAGCAHMRGIVTFNFSPRNLTQVTSTMKPGQDSMFGFSSVKRIALREGLY